MYVCKLHYTEHTIVCTVTKHISCCKSSTNDMAYILCKYLPKCLVPYSWPTHYLFFSNLGLYYTYILIMQVLITYVMYIIHSTYHIPTQHKSLWSRLKLNQKPYRTTYLLPTKYKAHSLCMDFKILVHTNIFLSIIFAPYLPKICCRTN